MTFKKILFTVVGVVPLIAASLAYRIGNYATALRLFRLAADQNQTDAQAMLGLMYQEGQGVPQDYAEAVKWYRLAADQAQTDAQAMLGQMYYEGQGVPQDYAEAVKWYRLAADQGYDSAQARLGLMYHEGQGVPQDYVRAHMWFNLSVTQGFQNAVKGRDMVAGAMTPAQIEEAQRLAREWTPTTHPLLRR